MTLLRFLLLTVLLVPVSLHAAAAGSTNIFKVPNISLGGKTNILSDNGTNLTYNGSALGLSASPVFTGSATATNFVTVPLVVTYSTSLSVDFAGSGDLWTVLAGSTTLSSANLSAGPAILYRFDNTTATNCNIILPSTWRKISGTTTNILAPGAIGWLTAKSYAANDTNVISSWASE